MDLVVEFLRHNTAMNRRLVEACRPLTAEQLDASVEGTYGPIGATLVHMANSQAGYVARFIAEERPEPLAQDPFPGIDAVAERLEHGNALLEQAAARAGEGHEVEVSGDDPPGTWSMPAALLLLQAVNHNTEHRSQVATILTQLGVEPPAMDGWAYFFDSGHMADVDPTGS